MAAALTALDGAIRRYDWGSRTAIPQLLGVDATDEPVAELWFGAHPDDPSRARAHDMPLDDLIATDPSGLLGRRDAQRFGRQLPFLLKVLAADRALSMQVHPNRAQAEAGYAAEDQRDVPRDAPQRNYRDRNHKPELLCALSPFDALCGFRPVEATLPLFDALGVPELGPYRRQLVQAQGLATLFRSWLELAAPDRGALLAAVVPAAKRLADADGPWRLAASFAATVAEQYPDDPGVLLSLLLNAVRLAPGEAVYLGAGNVHAYLSGVGVEVMANSDNVLRCAFTSKHVDVAEVLAITEFVPLADPLCLVLPGAAGGRAFVTPVPDFALSVIDIDGPTTLVAEGAEILLCTAGELEVVAGDDRAALDRGYAVFVAAGSSCLLTGNGTIFRATTGA